MEVIWVAYIGTIVSLVIIKECGKKKKEKNGIEKTKNEIEALNFYEGYNYTLQELQPKKLIDLKGIRLVTILYIVFVIIGEIIYKTKIPILECALELLMLIVAYTLVYVVMAKIKKKELTDDILKEKFYKEVCKPLLEEQGHHNIKLGVANIPAWNIGLVRGDAMLTTYGEVTCDEFIYRAVEYYHEEEYYTNDGKSSETVRTFSGNEFFIPCNTGVDDIVRIIPTKIGYNGKEFLCEGISKGKMEGEEHVDIEDIEFNRIFEVYSKNPHSAFYFLNSERIEYIKTLRQKSAISIVIAKQGIYVATDKRTKFFEMPSIAETIIKYEEITEERFRRDLRKFESLLEEYRKIL